VESVQIGASSPASKASHHLCGISARDRAKHQRGAGSHGRWPRLDRHDRTDAAIRFGL